MVELLQDEAGTVVPKPLTVAEVAKMLGRSPDYVRDHRHELGVLPATGTRPRLMFDPRAVRQAMQATPEAVSPRVDKPTPNTRRRRSRSQADLLPIGGRG